MAYVLVVEDDPDVAALVSAVLSAAGHEVDVARDGGAGVAAAQARRPDVMVLDWMMPVKNGIEVCETLRADDAFAKTRIMMLTARSSAADVTRAKDAGADDFFVKPFAPRELRARVAALIG